MQRRWLGTALAVAALGALAPMAQAKTAADAFADAEVLTAPGYVYDNTTGNTVEPGEPQPCGSIGATTWYRFDSPPVGAGIALTTYASFDAVLAVYTGPSLSQLQLVGCDDDSGTPSSSAALRFVPDQATTYWVQLGGFEGKAGSFDLQVQHTPANDLKAYALDASNGFDGMVESYGTGWGDEDPFTCTSNRKSLWYRVDVPKDTDVAVAVDHPGNNWTVDVFEERPDGRLEGRACESTYYNGDDFDPLRLQVPARAGSRLFVRLSTDSDNDARLRIAPLHLPQYQHPHDRPEAAKRITSLPFHDDTDTVFASTAGEPTMCSLPTATVWYRFTPAVPTPVVAHTVGSDFDAFIGVYRQDPTGLTEIACNDDASLQAGLYDSVVRFVAEAGQTYLFQVGGFDGRSGVLSFDVAGVAPGLPT